MQTQKDAEILGWLGRVGAASAEHVMARFQMGCSWAYARLHALVRDGLLEHKQLLHGASGLDIATGDGLCWTGLDCLGGYRLSSGTVQHATELATVVVALHGALPDRQQPTDRELRVKEVDAPQLIVSARRGELSGGRPAMHRPDLALLGAGESTVVIEVELSVKASRRFPAICRVYYAVTPPAVRVVAQREFAPSVNAIVKLAAALGVPAWRELFRRARI